MRIDDIKLLFDYHYWATQRILETTAQVSEAQYIAPANTGISFGSLRGALVHLVDTEWQWRITCQGFYAAQMTEAEYEATELKEEHFPTLEGVLTRWHTEEQSMRAYIESLNDEQLNGFIRITLPSGTVRERVLWHCLVHVVNHGTQHRSEAAALLTTYGHSPGDLDFTLFLNKRFNLPD